MKIAEDSAKIMDGQYSLKLPFRRDDVCLPHNRHMTEQCLTENSKGTRHSTGAIEPESWKGLVHSPSWGVPPQKRETQKCF